MSLVEETGNTASPDSGVPASRTFTVTATGSTYVYDFPPWVLIGYSGDWDIEGAHFQFHIVSHAKQVTFHGADLRFVASSDGSSLQIYSGADLLDTVSWFRDGIHFPAYGIYTATGGYAGVTYGKAFPDGQTIPVDFSTPELSFQLVYQAFTQYLETAVLNDGTVVNLRDGVPLTGTSGGDYLTDFDINPQTGLGFNDTLHGLGGNDTLRASGGNDKLYGDDGSDSLWAGAGADFLDGGAGQDFGYFDFSSQTAAVAFINGAAAGQTYGATVGGTAAGSVKDVEYLSVTAGSGNDRIGGVYGGLGALDGNSYYVFLDGGQGSDVAVIDMSSYAGLVGGGLTAHLGSSSAGDTLSWAGAGKIYLSSIEALEFTGNGASLHGGEGDDILRGLAGDDIFYGNEGNDQIYGGGGRDLLWTGKGNNLIDGGDGQDFAYFDFADRTQSLVLVDLAVSGQTYGATVGGTAAGSVKDVEYLSVTAGSGNDRIGGVYSGLGALDGNSYYVFLDGGQGSDVAVIDMSSYAGLVGGGLTAHLGSSGAGDTLSWAGAGKIYLSGIEALEFTGNGAGLHGGEGDDILRGLAGDDVFYGNEGNDQILGGGGTDQLWGGVGQDWLQGGDGADVLMGGDGHDSLWGGAGDDVLEGGDGDDTMDGGAGFDTVTYASRGAAVEVDLSIVEDQLTRGAGVDTLISIEMLIGSAFDDSLGGDDLANTLSGGDGADRLRGGGGADTLTGGGNIDVFVYGSTLDSRPSAADLITDFASGADHIDLSAIDADLATAGDQAFHLGATAGHAGDIVQTYDSANGRTVISLYVDADATADAVIWLSGYQPTLTSADFIL